MVSPARIPGRTASSSQLRTRPLTKAPIGRIPKEDRRKQLLSVAAQILTEQGVEQVQITEVAERAQVSRPLVYRLFPTRKALVIALLNDFATHLGERFQAALLATWPGTVPDITRAFVDASCEAIEEYGAGPWLLLDNKGSDPELGRIGRTVLADLLVPWQKRLRELTGLPTRRSANLLWVVVAAGRAALDGWIEGSISRRMATEDATRAVTALLLIFARLQPSSPTLNDT